jgi:amino acid adenylation domain-containing protein
MPIPLPRTAPIRLSEVQERLWAQQGLGIGAAWTVSGSLELSGPLDVKALGTALDLLVARHEPLRTHFVADADGVPHQIVADRGAADFRVWRVERTEVAALVRAHEQQTFDLEHGPLFQVLLLQLDANEHVLSLAMHHIIADGWSLDVLVRDMQELYRAAVEKETPKLAPLRIQYADWADWQRKRDSSHALAFWKRVLANPSVPLTMSAKALEPRGAARHVQRAVPSKLAESLARYARERRASLFMVLVAGWALLAYRRTRMPDLLLGTTVAGRGRTETEPLIGFFINIVALRLNLLGNRSGDELMDQVRQVVLNSFEHQEFPFERLLSEVDGLRQPSGRSPVPVMLRHQNFRQTDMGLWAGGVATRPFGGERTRLAASDLDLQYYGEGVELTVTAEYDANKFEAAEINRLLDEVEMLLSRLVTEPHSSIAELLEPSAEECREREAALCGPKSAWGKESVIELFVRQVAQRSKAVACRHMGQAWTYEQVDQRSDVVARLLERHGVAPGERVALCLPRGADLLSSVLGLWKKGAVYVPVDPHYPADWIARILAEVTPRMVIVASVEDWKLGHETGNTLIVALDEPAYVEKSGKAPEWCEPGQEDVAYISYTSGSTGQPKGAMVHHGQLLNCLHSLWDAQPFAPDEVVAQKTPTGFVVHLKELFAGLLAGVEQWVAPDELVRDTPMFALALAQHRVTRLNLVPTQLEALLDHAEHLGTLRRVVTAGEPLPESVRARFADLLPTAHLHNNYGCTELNDITYYHAAGPGIIAEVASAVPLGTPIANTRLHLLDDDLQRVPPEVVGELWVEGASVGTQGYYNQPELTAERWSPNPFDGGQTRIFRTGDLAQLSRMPDGSLRLQYGGRADFQVKLRGQKVDPFGVEQVLLEHPRLLRAAVRGWDSGTTDALLAAYYVVHSQADRIGSVASASDEAEPDPNKLFRWLKARIPAHMVPSVWVRLDELPTLPNGKLDRNALPRPQPTAANGQQSLRGPREQALASIWAEILRLPVEQISREDNFFAIGGNSMLAVQLVERMRAQGWVADVQLLFNNSTLKDQAEELGVGTAFEVAPNLIPDACEAIEPEMLPLVNLSKVEIVSVAERIPGGSPNIQDIYPIAPLQEGLFYHHLANPEGDAYLLTNMLAVNNREDAMALFKAMQATVDRHDILRTALFWEGLSEPVQVVMRKATMAVEEIEIPSTELEAAEYLKERFDPRHFRIDLRKAPLLHACLTYDESNDRWIVLLLFHHLIMDRLSLELVQEEIRAQMWGEAESLPPALPYRNFVAQARLGTDRPEQKRFFQEMLADFDEPTVPFGISGAADRDKEEATLPVETQLAARLRERARLLRMTVASFFHLAWAHVLAETSRSEDVVFGTVLSGRMRAGAGADRVLGLFVNTLPIRIRVGEEDVLVQIKKVNETLSELLTHEQTPLALAQRCSGIPAPHPLIFASLNYRHYMQAGGKAPERAFPVESLAAQDGSAYPVRMAVDDTGSTFLLRAAVNLDLDAGRICSYMHRALEQLLELLDEEIHEQYA